jgi:hypothetical protein
MDELVNNLKDVIENIRQFNEDIKNRTDLNSQLSQFKHWYFIPSLNLFGPSKYIGYKKMNSEKYDRGARKTGIDTENVLKMWFVKLPPTSNRSKQLRFEVESLISEYDKKINKAAVIHILKNGISV